VKVCAACGQTKPLSDFNRNGNGVQSRCRECFSAYNRQRYEAKRDEIKSKAAAYYEAHRDEAAAYHAERYRANAEAVKARVAARYQADPDKAKAYNAGYYQSHAETIKAQVKEYQKDNRETIAVRRSEYRQQRSDIFLYNYAKAHVLSPDQLVERFTRREIWERDGGICYLCGQAVSYEVSTIDHEIPLSRGGLHARSNVKIAHRRCNQSKRNKLIEEMERPYVQPIN
jgi:5-methylcytosine-specific restriction endonuclease McrA